MRSRTNTVQVGILGAIVAAAMLFAAAPASATTLQGPWAPFDRCPVDDPAMLAVQDSGNACVFSDSPHGNIRIGATSVTTGRTNLQLGAYGPGIPNVAGASLISDPVKIPGGLLGLMCPSDVPLVSDTCALLADNDLNRVNATVEPAGAPSEFNLFAPILGGPIVKLPVKIHLQNPLLGATCFIGSDANPIVLQPHQDPLSTGISFVDDPLGSAASFITPTGPGPISQIDANFAVPEAQGCGPLGLLSFAVNLKQGLPSPAGQNQLVLSDSTSGIVGSAPSGQALSDAWHAAVVTP